jgi:hypothetical protein
VAESDNSVAKTLLLVFGSLACVVALACCGGGFWLYFKANEIAQKVQEAVKDVALTDPAAIRRVTAEITDISIPTQFVPAAGTSFIGTKFVLYNWCPTGTCDEPQGNLGGLSLLSVRLQGAGLKAELPDLTKTLTDEEIAKSLKDFTKTEHEFDIRHHRCKFYVIKGEVRAKPLPTAVAKTATKTNRQEAPTDDDLQNPGLTMQFSDQQWAGQKIVRVDGRFPGKDAECVLMMRLKADLYNEEKIFKMLKSIK